MNGEWSFYRLDTGEMTGRTFSGREDFLAQNTPEGCGAVAGNFDARVTRFDLERGQAEPMEPVPATDEALAAAARAERDSRLAACDWVALRALDSGKKATPAPWAAYRTALRDITAQPGFPRAIEWPAQPT